MFVCVVRVFAGSVVGVVERSLVGMKLSGSYFVEVECSLPRPVFGGRRQKSRWNI